MAANIHCLLARFWVLWEEQSPSCNKELLWTTLWPLRHSLEVTDVSTLHITWQEPPLFPNGFVVTGIEINSMGFFFQLEEQDSFLKDGFVLWCVKVCLLHAGVEVTGPEQSRKEKRCVLSVHHLCGEGSGMGCLCELCLLQGASSSAWKAAWRWNCTWEIWAQMLKSWFLEWNKELNF